MGIGVGIFLVAVGAILAFAVNTTTEAVDLETIGVILMVVGAVGIALSMAFWSSWGGGGISRRRVETYDSADPSRRVVRDETYDQR
ncbi:MAG: DUF6458 family protein [Sporichthyaceae bacterium]|jgi:hypothetical protein